MAIGGVDPAETQVTIEVGQQDIGMFVNGLQHARLAGLLALQFQHPRVLRMTRLELAGHAVQGLGQAANFPRPAGDLVRRNLAPTDGLGEFAEGLHRAETRPATAAAMRKAPSATNAKTAPS